MTFFPFKEYGDSSNPPLVLIPGLDGITAFFSDSVPELTPYFHVIVLNLPLAKHPFTRWRTGGNGKGEGKYTLAYIAQKIAAAMDEASSPSLDFAGIEGGAPVVGESFGGMIAQRLALDFPEKVTKLVLLSSLAKTELTPVVKFKATFLLPIVEALGFALPSVAQSIFAKVHVSDVVESHEADWVKKLFLKEASWAHHYSVMARCKVALHHDTTAELDKIKVGALIMYGEDDTFTEVGAKQLLEGIAGSIAQGLPGGHLPHVSRPKEFAAAVTSYCAPGAASSGGEVKDMDIGMDFSDVVTVGGERKDEES
ncbi:unnamed protein product [Choristocarpus tenellus]